MNEIMYLAWDTPEQVVSSSGGAWTIVLDLFKIVGIAIVLWTLWKAITGFAKGADGKLFRTILMGIIGAVLAFQPMIAINLVSASGSLVEKGLCTVGQALDSSRTCASAPGSNNGTQSGTTTPSSPAVVP